MKTNIENMTEAQLRRELVTCRNELCLKCGAYRNRHLGACNGCRWWYEEPTDGEE